jgi:sec-independent protein translocase protein TatB
VADLSAAKILVVLVVALLVLGPDKLPRAAHQAGRLASDFRRFRDGLHSEVRQAFGEPLAKTPGRARSWTNQAFVDSVTAEVRSLTQTVENLTPQGGPTPGDASNEAPPGSGPAVEGVSTGPGPATAVAVQEPDGGGFDRGFN